MKVQAGEANADTEMGNAMRMLMKVHLDTEMANRGIKDGTLQSTMRAAMDQLRPEAAYFTSENGLRTAYFFIDMREPASLPVIAEPFFMNLGAKIDVSPAMNIDDVRTGLEEAMKNVR